IALALLLLHRITLGVVDQAAGTLGLRAGLHLGDDGVEVGGVGLDRAGQRIAAQRAEAHATHGGLFAVAQPEAVVIDHHQRSVALDHRPFGGEVQRHHRDALAADIAPDVELGPVRQREYAHALARVHPRVVEVPQLRPLPARVPALLAVAEGKHALLGARLLLVAAGATDRGVV